VPSPLGPRHCGQFSAPAGPGKVSQAATSRIDGTVGRNDAARRHPASESMATIISIFLSWIPPQASPITQFADPFNFGAGGLKRPERAGDEWIAAATDRLVR
jgi:hypothetical protein